MSDTALLEPAADQTLAPLTDKQQKKADRQARKEKAKEEEKTEQKAVYYREPKPHRLVMSPKAYLKLQYLCHAVDVEVGCFGISRSMNDLFYVTDLVVIKQESSACSTEFDDKALSEYIDDMVDAGVDPQRCFKLWFHTHPEMSATPSITDETTFATKFNDTSWAVMAIMSKTGDQYARLKINGGPGVSIELPWVVDWPSMPVMMQDTCLNTMVDKWAEDVATLVTEKVFRPAVAQTVVTQVPVSTGFTHSMWDEDYYGYSSYNPGIVQAYSVEEDDALNRIDQVRIFDDCLYYMGWQFMEDAHRYEDAYQDAESEEIWKMGWEDVLREAQAYAELAVLPDELVTKGSWPKDRWQEYCDWLSMSCASVANKEINALEYELDNKLKEVEECSSTQTEISANATLFPPSDFPVQP